jgi:hypothetical protein
MFSVLLELLNLWQLRPCDPSKHQEAPTQRQSITAHEPWIESNNPSEYINGQKISWPAAQLSPSQGFCLMGMFIWEKQLRPAHVAVTTWRASEVIVSHKNERDKFLTPQLPIERCAHYEQFARNLPGPTPCFLIWRSYAHQQQRSLDPELLPTR